MRKSLMCQLNRNAWSKIWRFNRACLRFNKADTFRATYIPVRTHQNEINIWTYVIHWLYSLDLTLDLTLDPLTDSRPLTLDHIKYKYALVNYGKNILILLILLWPLSFQKETWIWQSAMLSSDSPKLSKCRVVFPIHVSS